MAAENLFEETSDDIEEREPLLVDKNISVFFPTQTTPSQELTPALSRFMARIEPCIENIRQRKPGHKLKSSVFNGITDALWRFYKHHRDDFGQAVDLLLSLEEWKTMVSPAEKVQYPRYLEIEKGIFCSRVNRVPANMIQILQEKIQAQMPPVEESLPKQHDFARRFRLRK